MSDSLITSYEKFIKRHLKLRQYVFFIIIIFLWICPSSYGQSDTGQSDTGQNDTIYFEPVGEFKAKWEELPPLDVLIDSAHHHSFFLKILMEESGLKKYEIKTAKNNWTQHFYLETYGRYGNWDSYVTNRYDDSPSGVSQSVQEQLAYSAGISIKVPLSALIDRKNRIRVAEKNYLKSKYQEDQLLHDISKEVILHYNELQKCIFLMDVKSKGLQEAEVQIIVAEKEYKDGVIPFSELARLKSIYNQSKEEFIKTKSEFSNVILLMEILTGIEF